MKKYFVLTATILCMFTSCERNEGILSDENRDLFGDKISSGRLFFTNDVTGSGLPNVLANTEIRLSFSGKNPATSYDRSVISNENGYYTFNNLPDDSLRFFSQITRDDIVFSLDESLSAAQTNKDFYLKANPDYLKGIVISVNDSLGGGIPKVRVGIYSSRLFAERDTSYQYTTPKPANDFGKLFFQNIPVGMHYFKVTDSLGTYWFYGYDSLLISGELDNLTLKVDF
ncbi:MAG TPA: carboxypeptidase-like regulatory domain-containing protein [Bacteroidales bacterium]|nr:carboxypeptidase-like regulatory domain-containing protein [Bacteroidales bacterium]